MTDLSPKLFAELVQLASNIRERSWKSDGKFGSYQLDFDASAEQACVQLDISTSWAKIVAILLFPGYEDVFDWCEREMGG